MPPMPPNEAPAEPSELAEEEDELQGFPSFTSTGTATRRGDVCKGNCENVGGGV